MRNTGTDFKRWVNDIVAICSRQFTFDAATERALRNVLNRQNNGIGNPFEFICDDVVTANARLKRAPDQGPFTLRVADYRFGAVDDSRFAGVNAELADVRAPKASSVLRHLLAR